MNIFFTYFSFTQYLISSFLLKILFILELYAKILILQTFMYMVFIIKSSAKLRKVPASRDFSSQALHLKISLK